jgi:hypothetical protein
VFYKNVQVFTENTIAYPKAIHVILHPIGLLLNYFEALDALNLNILYVHIIMRA